MLVNEHPFRAHCDLPSVAKMPAHKIAMPAIVRRIFLLPFGKLTLATDITIGTTKAAYGRIISTQRLQPSGGV